MATETQSHFTIEGKGHEIAGIKALLDTLTLKGCILTIDAPKEVALGHAIGCQTEIAEKIVA